MSTEDLMVVIRLGEEMRKAQKDYFRVRDRIALTKSKALERRFDDAVQAVLETEKLI